jgi:hypothetical protein
VEQSRKKQSSRAEKSIKGRNNIKYKVRWLDDPKRIHRRLRTTRDSQRKIMTLRMAREDREKEKIQSSQNLVKMA